MSTVGGLTRRSYYYGGMVSSAELSLFGFIALEIIFGVAIYFVRKRYDQ